ncbi:hypothetical protein DL93DRAFT_2050560 [Clavulina sp. PMI_390]|nr:hypothetical protein DL93DRAFT_2050560 [Clavulina sp. PMI_390]
MKSIALLAGLVAIASSLPIRREVPQEHSHNGIIATVRTLLQQNNPNEIQDPIFGLLGNAAGSAGQGKITNTDCLQQAIADQAFTNAKASGDVDGQVAALQFRALERNTGSVGLASVLCTETAVNPEVNAISQHQDPASTNAAATNKAIVLELAKQIASVGGDPTLALKTGTFAPGNIGDPTGKGNGCDTDEADEGCIFTQNLLVEDATDAEISAAVAGVSAPTGVAADAAGGSTTVSATITCNASPTAAATTTTTSAAIEATTTSSSTTSTTTATTTTSNNNTSGNLQTFTGALGGISAPAVTKSGNNFVTDNSNFVTINAALGRSCDVQHNQCANLANSGGQSFTVGDCDTQDTQCKAA